MQYLLLLLFLGVTTLSAQNIGIGYYDLDGLYDTIPSSFYDDSAYTPEGRLRWSSERYERKIRNTAAVLDSMALPIVGLYGVENQGVVRDIVECCTQDYTYIHSTRNSFDGMDFALLYFGDQLFVDGHDAVEAGRNMLAIKAELCDNTPITIILTRSGGDTLVYLEEQEPEELVVVLGRLYENEIDKMGYTSLLRERERRGEGNYCSYRGYMMHDRIATSCDRKILKSGVFITPWLLTSDKRSPLATFNKSAYVGGYSKYLPIFVYLF